MMPATILSQDVCGPVNVPGQVEATGSCLGSSTQAPIGLTLHFSLWYMYSLPGNGSLTTLQRYYAE